MKIPKHLELTTRLTAGITSVVSVVYLVLSIFALIYYFQCGEEDQTGYHFWGQVYKVYLQDVSCSNATSLVPEVTQSYTVFVFMTIVLSFSVVALIASAALFFVITDEDQVQYINIYVYVYVCTWLATLVVDVVLGAHLGIDIANLADLIEASPNAILFQTLRHGAFYLMTIALKGFTVHAINIVLIALLIVFLTQYQTEAQKEMHSMYSERPLQAFEFGNVLEYTSPPRPAPVKDMHPSYSRETNDYIRSNSWKQPHRSEYMPEVRHEPYAPPAVPAVLSERPYSYLNDASMPQPPRPKYSRQPHVPAPDYSPRASRLKSALKTY